MRDDCVKNLFQIFFKIMTGNNLNLTKFTLQTLKNYIDWVDIKFVTNDEYSKLFYQFVSTEGLQLETLECLEMVRSIQLTCRLPVKVWILKKSLNF